MLISEIYRSNQGEGILSGTPSVFVRISGCNLRCSFCDTPFASWEPVGTQYSTNAILQAAQQCIEDNPNEPPHAVLTGGEPMLPTEIVDLSHALTAAQFHITIETAGTIHRSVACDLMSISPKMSNSTPTVERAGQWAAKHERARHNITAVKRLIDEYPYQLKFVVKQPEDMDEIFSFLDLLPAVEKSRVLLMPEGVTTTALQSRAVWLAKICADNDFQFCQRQHIFWYGNRRGT